MYYVIVKNTEQGNKYLWEIGGRYYDWTSHLNYALFCETRQEAQQLCNKYGGNVFGCMITLTTVYA